MKVPVVAAICFAIEMKVPVVAAKCFAIKIKVPVVQTGYFVGVCEVMKRFFT